MSSPQAPESAKSWRDTAPRPGVARRQGEARSESPSHEQARGCSPSTPPALCSKRSPPARASSLRRAARPRLGSQPRPQPCRTPGTAGLLRSLHTLPAPPTSASTRGWAQTGTGLTHARRLLSAQVHPAVNFRGITSSISENQGSTHPRSSTEKASLDTTHAEHFYQYHGFVSSDERPALLSLGIGGFPIRSPRAVPAAEGQPATQGCTHQRRAWASVTLGMSCTSTHTYNACESLDKYNSFN